MIPSGSVLIIPVLIIICGGAAILGSIVGAMCAVFDGGTSVSRKVGYGAVGGIAGGFVGPFLSSGLFHLAVRMWGWKMWGWSDSFYLAVMVISVLGGAFVAARFMCPPQVARSR